MAQDYTFDYIVHKQDIDFYVYQGESWSQSYEVTDDSDSPMDLSGYTAKLQVRDRPGGVLLMSLTSGSGITITGLVGKIDMEATAAETNALQFSIGRYDIYIEKSGEITFLFKGNCVLVPRISE